MANGDAPYGFNPVNSLGAEETARRQNYPSGTTAGAQTEIAAKQKSYETGVGQTGGRKRIKQNGN